MTTPLHEETCDIPTPPREESWIEEFDDKFYGDLPDFISPFNNEICGEKVKSFIHSLLLSQKQSLIREVEGKRDCPPPYSADKNNPIKHCYQNEGYNSALEDIITLLKK